MSKTPPHFGTPPLSARLRFQASAEKSPSKISEFWSASCDSSEGVQNSSAPTALACKALRRAGVALLLALTFQNSGLAQETSEKPAEANNLTAEQTAAGWVLLFDGKTLDGWRPTGNADWKVENGEIQVTTGDAGWLMTNDEYADYELHVEFKAPATTNSGIFLRTPLDPKDPAKDCYEINIAPDDNPFPTGSIVGRQKRPEQGWSTYDLLTHEKNQERLRARAEGWSTLSIKAEGGAFMITLNEELLAFNRDGKLVTYEDTKPIPRGHIGLQFREGQVAFRNIRIKVLPAKKWEAE